MRTRALTGLFVLYELQPILVGLTLGRLIGLSATEQPPDVIAFIGAGLLMVSIGFRSLVSDRRMP